MDAVLDAKMINDLKPKIEATVTHHFREPFTKKAILPKVQTLLVLKLLRGIFLIFCSTNWLALIMETKLKLKLLNQRLSLTVNIPELQTPIQIIGTIDRVDSL